MFGSVQNPAQFVAGAFNLTHNVAEDLDVGFLDYKFSGPTTVVC
jgi:hypothetical protein